MRRARTHSFIANRVPSYLTPPLSLTQAQFIALGTTPRALVAGQANAIIVPEFLWGRARTTIAWTSDPTFRVRFDGDPLLIDLTGTFQLGTTNVNTTWGFAGSVVNGPSFQLATFSPVGKAVMLVSDDITGAGASDTILFVMRYTVIPLS